MPLTPTSADSFATSWYAAWNALDLDAIMAHYASAIRHSSPFIKRYNGTDALALEGAPAVRATSAAPSSETRHCKGPLHATIGLESVILVYHRMTGDLAAEIFFFDDTMKVVRSVSHYG